MNVLCANTCAIRRDAIVKSGKTLLPAMSAENVSKAMYLGRLAASEAMNDNV